MPSILLLLRLINFNRMERASHERAAAKAIGRPNMMHDQRPQYLIVKAAGHGQAPI